MLVIPAAVYAGTTGEPSVAHVVVAAIIGAIVGDNVGSWTRADCRVPLGAAPSITVAAHHTPAQARAVSVPPAWRQGGVLRALRAVLRVLAALLAGLNCMNWGRFLLFNALGGMVWAAAYGLGVYAFGEALTSALRRFGVVLGIAAAAAIVVVLLVVRRFERQMEDTAERALPGPLQGPGGCATPDSTAV